MTIFSATIKLVIAVVFFLLINSTLLIIIQKTWSLHYLNFLNKLSIYLCLHYKREKDYIKDKFYTTVSQQEVFSKNQNSLGFF